MASVHQVKTSKYWFGSFYKPNGTRVFRSTRQEKKENALRVVMEWERVARGELPTSAEQARRVLSDIVKIALGDAKTRITCREYVTRWLATQKGTVAAATLEFYDSALKAWLEWLGPRADTALDAIQKEDFVAFRTAESKRVSSATANHKLTAVKMLFNAAVGESFVSVNPGTGIKKLRKDRKAVKVRRPFTMEELHKLTAVMDEEWQLITSVGLYTGQRLGDVLSLRRSEIDEAKNAITLVTGKVGLRLWIPIPDHLTKRLLVWWKTNGGGDFVFRRWVESMAKRESGKAGKASDRFSHWLYLAGLRAKSPFTAGKKSKRRRNGESPAAETVADDRREQHELSFHCLRHTARTLLEEAGEPKAVIDAFIGHEGETGRIYTSVGEAALRKTAEALAKAVGRE